MREGESEAGMGGAEGNDENNHKNNDKMTSGDRRDTHQETGERPRDPQRERWAGMGQGGGGGGRNRGRQRKETQRPPERDSARLNPKP
jgi:hypothetical protein